MHQLEVRTAIERSWTVTTTFCPEDWLEHDPAWGQCGVTAVLLVDLYGGGLRRGVVQVPGGWSTTHYWACIDGMDADLTWRQFPVGSEVRDVEVIEREVILANPWMIGRYTELCANFDRHRAGRSLLPFRSQVAVLAAASSAPA